MHTTWPLYAITLDGAGFALVRAFDEVEALDLAFCLYTAQCRGPMGYAGWPPPVISAAEHRRRLAARPATDTEEQRFAAIALSRASDG